MTRIIAESIFLYSLSIDMRKGIHGLCALLDEHEITPIDGALYLFSNRKGRTVKGLWWDKNGYILLYKRLEHGKFKLTFDEHGRYAAISPSQLAWLLAGLEYRKQEIFPELDIQDFY